MFVCMYNRTLFKCTRVCSFSLSHTLSRCVCVCAYFSFGLAHASLTWNHTLISECAGDLEPWNSKQKINIFTTTEKFVHWPDRKFCFIRLLRKNGNMCRKCEKLHRSTWIGASLNWKSFFYWIQFKKFDTF